MHEIDKMQKIENISTITHQPHGNTNIFSRNPLREKTQLKCEASLLSFLLYGNNASTKEKTLSMELPETLGLLGYYKTLTPYFMLSNFPLLVDLRIYGKK
jgi:hypothetical protein